ncbi:MAG: hypothetical protein OHK0029_26280 [Armatimonadaceae bacterium]
MSETAPNEKPATPVEPTLELEAESLKNANSGQTDTTIEMPQAKENTDTPLEFDTTEDLNNLSEPLFCPKCRSVKVQMERVSFQEVEVDRCPQCLGIWFDLQEHETLRALPGSELPGSERIDTGAAGAVVTEDSQQLDCPRCRARMYTTRDPEQTHLVFEKCSVCYGVFFDAGEFTDFKQVTILERIRSLFS